LNSSINALVEMWLAELELAACSVVVSAAAGTLLGTVALCATCVPPNVTADDTACAVESTSTLVAGAVAADADGAGAGAGAVGAGVAVGASRDDAAGTSSVVAGRFGESGWLVARAVPGAVAGRFGLLCEATIAASVGRFGLSPGLEPVRPAGGSCTVEAETAVSGA